MKNPLRDAGKISNHFSGQGTVTEEMVARRAREIAQINGRDGREYSENEFQQAKDELLGIHSEAPNEAEAVAFVAQWDEAPGSTGHRVPSTLPNDEQSVAERLVEEGMEEANHDRMLQGVKEERNQA